MLKYNRANFSSFKKFFKLTVEDRPISPFRKGYEIWKTNPVARRLSMGLKWSFALGFVLWWKQGISIPGQYYMRLAEIELRYRLSVVWKKNS